MTAISTELRKHYPNVDVNALRNVRYSPKLLGCPPDDIESEASRLLQQPLADVFCEYIMAVEVRKSERGGLQEVIGQAAAVAPPILATLVLHKIRVAAYQVLYGSIRIAA